FLPTLSRSTQRSGRLWACVQPHLPPAESPPCAPPPVRVKLGSRLLTVGQFSEQRDDTSYQVKALNREGYGEYTCDITNEAGAGRCTFLVTGKAHAPEFYYDTYSALWQNRPGSTASSCSGPRWSPATVDRILAYRLGIRQMTQSRWWEQEIPIEGNVQKGELLTYNLTELIKPESYLVRLTPITRYGEGDATERIITYSGNVSSLQHLCRFEFATFFPFVSAAETTFSI
ncbi:hypothetical protein KUCAC02_035800, partial [Chaenocephalus aceratus]